MRPREFDQDEILRIAFEQFWRRGVRGAALSDIAAEAGIQRGSLYNAFGSKEALFLSAYERYAGGYLQAVRKALGAGLQTPGPLRKRLLALFDLTIKNFRAGSPPRGCPTTRGLMEMTATDDAAADEAVRQAFATLISRITALIQEALSDGARRGEFSGNAATAALHVATVIRGLAVMERAFDDEAQLRKIAAHTVDLILGKKSR